MKQLFLWALTSFVTLIMMSFGLLIGEFDRKDFLKTWITSVLVTGTLFALWWFFDAHVILH
jgi:hypothetical protein